MDGALPAASAAFANARVSVRAWAAPAGASEIMTASFRKGWTGAGRQEDADGNGLPLIGVPRLRRRSGNTLREMRT
jgi:hypothetical protein